MHKVSLRFLVVLAVVAFVGMGCFNDAFRGHDFRGGVGADRFALVIEPDRTLVDGTHFLVDRATGDLWLLDVSNRRNGEWVRLASGPTDAAELELEIDVKKEEEEEED